MVRLIKESFSNDRYEEAQNYIDNGMTTWREIFQDCSEIARTDKELKQSMIDQRGSISKYAEEIFDAVQDILGNEANESVKRNESVKKKNSKSVKEARIGRTKEVKVLQGNWGSGWDDLCEYDKYDNGECRADLKAYMENDPTARYRVIFRRVPNKDYVEK